MKEIYALKPSLLEQYVISKTDLYNISKTMGTQDVKEAKEEIIFEANINDLNEKGIAEYEVKNGVAYIPIQGMLVNKVSPCSAFFGETVTSYAFIRQATAQAEQDQLVSKIAYMCESGGGYVSECANTFESIAFCSKPTTAFVGEMSASACYWLASACDEIVSTSKTGFVGSIGVAVEVINRDKQDDNYGIKRTTFTNSTSKNKRPNLAEEEGQAVLVKELDDLFQVFTDSILLKRGDKLSKESLEAMDGKVFIQSEALANGLIDKSIRSCDIMTYMSGDQIEEPKQVAKVEPKEEAKKPTEEGNEDMEAKQIEAIKKAEAERVANILEIAGADVSEIAIKAIKEGTSHGDFALEKSRADKAEETAEIEAEKERRAKAKINPIGGVTGQTQTPADTVINDDTKKADIDKAIDDILNLG